MNISAYIIDAFTSLPFRGNPAAVCFLATEQSSEWMQNIAREFNLPETAFVRQVGDKTHLRWFTVETEVPLCGHATLAAYHALREEKRDIENVCFLTKSGPLYVSHTSSAITMNFPTIPVLPVRSQETISKDMLGTNVTILNCMRSSPSDEEYPWLIVEVKQEDLRTLQPRFQALRTLPYIGIIVTTEGSVSESVKADFSSRVFVPRVGINEDSVTGAAHCCLIRYWNERSGHNSFTAYQASERGGILQLELTTDKTDTRVNIGGTAITILRGSISL